MANSILSNMLLLIVSEKYRSILIFVLGNANVHNELQYVRTHLVFV